ncbi:hypothetical protein HZ326_27433 [Fusarium oxysporum f. sp. albedinis]|nr:hypothetical protein HZ326_27433 [Fusarium oxysporum f. sp. albedinis]
MSSGEIQSCFIDVARMIASSKSTLYTSTKWFSVRTWILNSRWKRNSKVPSWFKSSTNTCKGIHAYPNNKGGVAKASRKSFPYERKSSANPKLRKTTL